MKKLRLWEVNSVQSQLLLVYKNGKSLFAEIRVLTWLAEKAALLPRVTKALSVITGSSVDSSR